MNRKLHLSDPSHEGDDTLYTVTIDPTGEKLVGLTVTDDGEVPATLQVTTWNTAGEARTLGTILLPDPDEARLEAAYNRALESIPERVELATISYDDQLTDQQIQSAFAGTIPWEIGDFDEWESEARHNGLWATLEYHVDEEDLDLLRADESKFEDLQLAVQERDESDAFSALARQTNHRWIRYALDVDVSDSMFVDSDQVEEDMAAIAETLNLEQTPENIARLRELATEAGGGHLHVYWYGAVDELIEAAQYTDHTGKPLAETITWENPHLLVLDQLNGSGHMVAYPGTITLPFDRNRLKLDARNIGNGYSWSEDVAGLASDRAGTTVTITSPDNS